MTKVQPTSSIPVLGIVGGGAVAHALSAALGSRWSLRIWARRSDASASVLGAACSTAAHAAVSRSPMDPAALSHIQATSPADLADCDVVLVAVTDSAIRSVAEGLLAALGEQPNYDAGDRTRPVVLHTSGALTGEDALGPLGSHGWPVGSLHPLVAVAPSTNPPSTVFAGMPLAIEGAGERALHQAERLVEHLGGYALRLPTTDSVEAARAQKARYHALATMVATGVVALVDQAAAAFSANDDRNGAEAGEREALFRQAYAQLAQSAAQNVHRAPGADVLTGAVARDDQRLIEHHLRALQGLDEANLYRAVETAARIMLQRRGADRLS